MFNLQKKTRAKNWK